MAKRDKNIIKRAAWDHEKDSIFKELASLLTAAGYDVRREELKTGHGWKVMSGSCRLEAQKLIFVDKKLPQDEQIAFLVGIINELKLQVPDERKASLPEKVRVLLSSIAVLAAA